MIFPLGAVCPHYCTCNGIVLKYMCTFFGGYYLSADICWWLSYHWLTCCG